MASARRASCRADPELVTTTFRSDEGLRSGSTRLSSLARIVALFALELLLASSELRADRWYVHYENAERALAAEHLASPVQKTARSYWERSEGEGRR
jgi:hypothetical protein